MKLHSGNGWDHIAHVIEVLPHSPTTGRVYLHFQTVPDIGFLLADFCPAISDTISGSVRKFFGYFREIDSRFLFSISVIWAV